MTICDDMRDAWKGRGDLVGKRMRWRLSDGAWRAFVADLHVRASRDGDDLKVPRIVETFMGCRLVRDGTLKSCEWQLELDVDQEAWASTVVDMRP